MTRGEKSSLVFDMMEMEIKLHELARRIEQLPRLTSSLRVSGQLVRVCGQIMTEAVKSLKGGDEGHG